MNSGYVMSVDTASIKYLTLAQNTRITHFQTFLFSLYKFCMISYVPLLAAFDEVVTSRDDISTSGKAILCGFHLTFNIHS